MPKEFREIKNKKLFDSDFVYSQDGIQLTSYKAKRNKTVLVLSSQHNDNKIGNGEKKKPEVILYYNDTKGGVDCVDERVATYSVKYISKRWHVTVFCNIIDLSCYNAYVLYTLVHPNYQHGKSHEKNFLVRSGNGP